MTSRQRYTVVKPDESVRAATTRRLNILRVCGIRDYVQLESSKSVEAQAALVVETARPTGKGKQAPTDLCSNRLVGYPSPTHRVKCWRTV